MLQIGAAEDLRSILKYTQETWGPVQARAYAKKLRTGLERLAEGQATYKPLTDIHPALRVTRCEQHYIFYLWREAQAVMIVAILHERMDLIARIKHRLT